MDKKADNIEMHDIEHSFESPITSEKKVNWMKILLVVGVVVVFSAISFYLGRSNQEKIDDSASGSTTTQSSTSPGQALKPGWTTYVHPVYKYRINLPPGWSAYTKTYDPTKQIELRSDDYTEVVTPEGAFQKSGKRIFFEYKSNMRKLTDYKITEQKSIEWLGTNAIFILGDGNDGTDTPSTMLLTTDVNGETYQLYWPNYDGRDTSTDADLLIEIAQSMSLGQRYINESNTAQESKKGWLTYTDDTAGFSIQYPEDMFTLCDSDTGGARDGIWFWSKGWDCQTPTDGGYIMSIVLQSTENFKKDTFTKNPAVETKITLDGKPALYRKYVFSDEDGKLGSIGEVREVILQTIDGTYVLESLGKNTENNKLFDEMIKTFRLTSVNR